MSAGPISRERRGHVVATDPVPKSEQQHAPGSTKGRAYCGRAKVAITDVWDLVSCPDCHAAHRADEAASS